MNLREFVTIKASRFDTKLQNRHINDCCRGDKFGKWLHAKLSEAATAKLEKLYQEDFGWVIDAPIDESSDVVMISVVFYPADEDSPDDLLCASIDTRSSFVTNLFRKDRKAKLLALKDDLTLQIDKILHRDNDIENIQWWDEGPVCGTPASHPS